MIFDSNLFKVECNLSDGSAVRHVQIGSFNSSTFDFLLYPILRIRRAFK